MTDTDQVPAARVRVEGDLYHPRVPAGAVYVGRQAPGLRRSPWNNPHPVGYCRACGTDHDQAGAILGYGQHLAANPALILDARRDLPGKPLACWCPPDQPCHADVLALVAAGMSPAAATAEILGGALPFWSSRSGLRWAPRPKDHGLRPVLMAREWPEWTPVASTTKGQARGSCP